MCSCCIRNILLPRRMSHFSLALTAFRIVLVVSIARAQHSLRSNTAEEIVTRLLAAVLLWGLI